VIFSVMLATMLLVPAGADAQGFHGLGVTKNCAGNALVGDPYECSYLISNSLDTGTGTPPGDTYLIKNLEDVISTFDPLAACAPITISSGDILRQLTLNTFGGASCVDDSPTQRTCTMPWGSTISSNSFTFHTPTEDEIECARNVNGEPRIDDDVRVTHEDTCSTGANNCPVGDNITEGASSTTFLSPCIDVIKSVDPTLSKVGDEVVYTIEVINCGDEDLVDITVDDTVLGDISGSFPSSLAIGGSSGQVQLPYTIQGGDCTPIPQPNLFIMR
jgi:uncharacterized repeat protein (TIGR01451 family)